MPGGDVHRLKTCDGYGLVGMQLYLKSVQGGVIRSLFEVLKEIVHDVNLRFDSTGIRLLTVDGAGCALVYMKLRAESFEEYRCEGTFDIGINMTSVFRLLKTTGSRDTVTLYMESQYSDELGIKIQNAEKNSITDFKLKLLDVDREEVKIPDVEFDSVITMPSEDFATKCKNMLLIGDTVMIRSESDRLTLACSGDYARQETVMGCWGSGSGMTMTSLSSKTVEASFSLKYLCLFCKAGSSNLCNTVEIFLKENFALILKYHVASLGEIRFCLAPKVEES
jgi:proliferating cell nuclear antigen